METRFHNYKLGFETALTGKTTHQMPICFPVVSRSILPENLDGSCPLETAGGKQEERGKESGDSWDRERQAMFLFSRISVVINPWLYNYLLSFQLILLLTGSLCNRSILVSQLFLWTALKLATFCLYSLETICAHFQWLTWTLGPPSLPAPPAQVWLDS